MFDLVAFEGRGADLIRSLLVKDDRNQIGSLILSGPCLIPLDSDRDFCEDFMESSDFYDSVWFFLNTHIWGIEEIEIEDMVLLSGRDLWVLLAVISIGDSNEVFLRSSFSVWLGWGWGGSFSLDLRRFGSSLLDSGFCKDHLAFVWSILMDLLVGGIMFLVLVMCYEAGFQCRLIWLVGALMLRLDMIWSVAGISLPRFDFLHGVIVAAERVMAQLAFSKSKASLVRTDTVSISNSVLAQRIQQFSKTLIGRLMNSVCQSMDSLLANFPKIWKLEEKVVGADLGQGVFQFNFEEEEDILSVLQNGPYHFDGWMVSLVRWEPIISSSYPSAVNFWVKVAGIPMHLWEVATLEAIGKKLGRIQEVDEETGSLCVSVNGFNPLIFKMVVPFATGDEIMVSLEYEKLNGVCDHCFRITHASNVCPEVLKVNSVQGAEAKRDNRGGQRQVPVVKQEQQHNVGGWEKPRKHAKRALDFYSVESSEHGYFPQQRFGGNGPHGSGSHGPRHQDRFYGQVWGQKRSFGEASGREEGFRQGSQPGLGEVSGKASGFSLNRKGKGPAWPKPLFPVKQTAFEKQGSMQLVNIGGDSSFSDPHVVKDGEGAFLAMDFAVDNDDLLEDGEFGDISKSDHNTVQEGVSSATQGVMGLTDQGHEIQDDHVTDPQGDSANDPQGDGNKQKQAGKQGNNTAGGIPSDGGRLGKKGMGALPKPSART
ncbi:PREDICTED: uncharacterized protein LOC104714873 [Camelina sativa]|uniref:Uncharacterized protein LOC104714873 n=1 Tax=Camelina sativa TaxID=90675 RepID=A0ABM1QF32_CAMSA|nr:PREDICTED: uncharacterized protein LOC104714873 [Camelina sativa]